MVKAIKTGETLSIPEGVTVTIKNKEVTVKGERGTLSRAFKEVPIDLKVVGDEITAEMWWGKKLTTSTIKSVLSHIRNMFTGVTVGYKYKMRFAYAHFPVGVTVDGNEIQVRNFLGEKRVRRVTLPEGVKASRTEASVMKDELVLEGNSITEVSITASQLHGVCLVKKKDIRKFLDGIYVSEKTTIKEVL
eukprot:TRINITY_DN2280_c0_g1_i1.p1 TRINITY_DN2280_c0_g1~~TRINITY_DN2280_c0_g1_i1.p1  ORF type:complete len:190 (+),score=104.98 TRINITY_DN2280_c0_g1_i1:46-615(+)